MSPSCAPTAPAVTLTVFDPQRLYQLPEVVEKTAFSRSLLYEHMAAGQLPYVKLGATRRLLGRDLNHFIARFYCPGEC
jgi:predicted DNA-binding transcriptional regulator AlpA